LGSRSKAADNRRRLGLARAMIMLTGVTRVLLSRCRLRVPCGAAVRRLGSGLWEARVDGGTRPSLYAQICPSLPCWSYGRPANLMALACGNLASRRPQERVSLRSGRAVRALDGTNAYTGELGGWTCVCCRASLCLLGMSSRWVISLCGLRIVDSGFPREAALSKPLRLDDIKLLMAVTIWHD
jgi:hypothetical protein